MYALFLVLNQIEKLDDILEALYKLGVGATTLDSVGMGRVLMEHNVNENIFSALRNVLNENKPYNKTVISVINNENILNEAVNRISKILDIDNKKGVGFLFVLPVIEYRGGFSKID
jgi:nitrogen regulatory protein PII